MTHICVNKLTTIGSDYGLSPGWRQARASTRIFARGCRDISRGCTRRKKVIDQSKNIMSGKIPADADRYRADGFVGRRQLTEALQAIIWTNAEILLIGPLGTNFNEILIEICAFIHKNPLENVIWKMAAILSRPQCVKNVNSPQCLQWWYSSHCYALSLSVLAYTKPKIITVNSLI